MPIKSRLRASTRKFKSRNLQQPIKSLLLLLIIIWFTAAVSISFSDPKNTLLTLVLILIAIERFIETFFTSKQNILKKNTRFDWIFISLTLGYIMLMYGSLLEAFFSPHKLSPLISIQGIIVYCLGLGLRWWSIKSLGFGWNLFISKKSIKKSVHLKLVKNGPYALVRHPIYIGTIFEILSIPIIANALFSLIFAIATIIPLLIIRALLEEEILVRYFKNRYAEYKKRTGFLMPKLF